MGAIWRPETNCHNNPIVVIYVKIWLYLKCDLFSKIEQQCWNLPTLRRSPNVSFDCCYIKVALISNAMKTRFSSQTIRMCNKSIINTLFTFWFALFVSVCVDCVTDSQQTDPYVGVNVGLDPDQTRNAVILSRLSHDFIWNALNLQYLSNHTIIITRFALILCESLYLFNAFHNRDEQSVPLTGRGREYGELCPIMPRVKGCKG